MEEEIGPTVERERPALRVTWRYLDDLPRQLYPGGPQGRQVIVSARGLVARCGHADVCHTVFNVLTEVARAMWPETLGAWLREAGLRAAIKHMAANDCSRCAPRPAAAGTSPANHFWISANVRERMEALAAYPNAGGSQERFVGIPVQFSELLPPDTWILMQDGRPVSMGRFKPDSLEDDLTQAATPAAPPAPDDGA